MAKSKFTAASARAINYAGVPSTHQRLAEKGDKALDNRARDFRARLKAIKISLPPAEREEGARRIKATLKFIAEEKARRLAGPSGGDHEGESVMTDRGNGDDLAAAISRLNGKIRRFGITVRMAEGAEGPRRFRAMIKFDPEDGEADRVVQFDTVEELLTISALLISGSVVKIIAKWDLAEEAGR